MLTSFLCSNTVLLVQQYNIKRQVWRGGTWAADKSMQVPALPSGFIMQ